MKILKCSHCFGDGLILVPNAKLPSNLAEALRAYVPCLLCPAGEELAPAFKADNEK